ncbi:carcinoembryonic antigen-related cell adhesion molecule 1-like [Trematomus bernacchii]|uniref:carcinoembryonic antigen-related cell adhesion molecule 1-like n=1 Tax=Trematomus bernacchii TaxID=40690 RepID=UPI00146C7D2A|nr:carcinoembryonic antigen-related cell adhesion molecule 1-like [Trematomus bernacchii]
MLITLNTSPPDAPKLPSVSVSPSAEIEEGSSVTLTCSSDANPAATYTWYKKNGKANIPLLSEGTQFVFSSIQSSDSGEYFCRAENKLGRRPSANTFIDVKYAPRIPSLSTLSGEIEEGSSVTLTCSSDANPAANYTWYKENEDPPKASGQIFNITDFRAEHSGSYFCEAQNKLGRSNSTLHLTVVAGTFYAFIYYHTHLSACLFSVTLSCAPRDHCFSGSWKLLPAAVTISVVLLAVIYLSVFLWIRRKKASRDLSEIEERADNGEECVPDQPEQQEDLQYSSVHFSNNRADPLYSNMRAAQPLRHTEQQEVPEYAAVKFSSAAPRTRGQDSEEYSCALYSTVNKSH